MKNLFFILLTIFIISSCSKKEENIVCTSEDWAGIYTLEGEPFECTIEGFETYNYVKTIEVVAVSDKTISINGKEHTIDRSFCFVNEDDVFIFFYFSINEIVYNGNNECKAVYVRE